jgi:nickel-dependent lactate racemase
MCARALENYKVYFYCSGIDPSELEQMFFRAVQSPQDAIDKAMEQKGPDARVLVLPQAVICVPRILELGLNKS